MSKLYVQRYVIALVVLGLIAGGFWFGLVNRQAGDNITQRPLAGVPADFPSHNQRNAAGFPTTNTVGNNAIGSRELAEGFEHSSNLRAFALAALQKPEIGGVYYARKAIEYCASPLLANGTVLLNTAQAMAAKDAATFARRQQLLSNYVNRCQGLTPSDVRAGDINFISKTNEGKDPLLGAKSAYLMAGESIENRSRAIRDLLALSDPNIIAELSANLLQVDAQDPKNTRLYFDGNWYSDERSVAEISAATAYSACLLGLRCDSESRMSEAACILQSENCGLSAIELFMKFYRVDSSRRSRVEEYGARMVAAVRNTELSVFIPQSK